MPEYHLPTREATPMSPKKPIIRPGKLPIDFFGKPNTLKVRKFSVERQHQSYRYSRTPHFSQSRSVWLQSQRKAGTAMNNYQREEELIQGIIFSSTNIKKLRRMSQQHPKMASVQKRSIKLPELPSIANRRAFKQ